MKIQIETNNHVGSQIMNICKKFDIKFTVERDGSLEYVDLGLPSGLKWVTCNVGAKTPCESGKYFRWGEVVDAREMGSVGTYDYNKPFEDAATYHMGKQWRMPTKEEFQELYDNTTSKWVENYQGSDVSGHLFTSKVNGNELFFPAAGYCGDGSLGYVGSNGYVWSSSLGSGNPSDTWDLGFNSGNVGMGRILRCYGFSVRAVRN